MKILILALLAASCYGQSIQCDPDQVCAQARSLTGWSAGTLWSASPTALEVRYASNFSYRAPMNSGLYVVTLYFVEPNATAKGQRVFDVRINQQLIYSKLDVFAITGGANRVLKRSVVVAVAENVLIIDFDAPGPTARPAVVSAIRIAPLGITLSE